MKVWEKVKEEAAKEKVDLDTSQRIQDWMYANRCTPCDMEEQFKILGNKKMNELCSEHQLDCLSCLEAYLKLEIN